MAFKIFLIVLIFLLGATLRFWGLGNTPDGLSIQEVEFALWGGKTVGDLLFNPFWTRFLFAFIGIIQILLLYLAVYKLKRDFKLAAVASFLLAILPWHIQESRVYSESIMIFTIFLVFIIFTSKFLLEKSGRLIYITTVSVVSILFFSLFQTDKNLELKVNEERFLIKDTPPTIARVFSNKAIEFYRTRQDLFFQNLDFGNYFFAGHPRERWGVEEIQKLYITLLPLIFIGLTKGKLKLGWLLVFSSILGLFLNIMIIFPVLILSAEGLVSISRKKAMLTIFVLLLAFETSLFLTLYFKGYSESQFSPRRPVYAQIAGLVKSLDKKDEPVLVNDGLDKGESYFRFYHNGRLPEEIKFGKFDIRDETSFNKLFVDILPDNPSPTEPLYKKNGNWPDYLKILAEFYDKTKRQTVVIYRHK